MRQVKAFTTSTAKSYRWVFNDGWLIVTINDETCELNIQSDWGNYGYRWSPGGWGTDESFTGFVARMYPDYMLGKFQLGTQSKNLEDVIDTDATLKKLRKQICSDRRSKDLTDAEARELWEQADAWEREDFYIPYCPYELGEYLGESPHYYIVEKNSGWYEVFREELIPLFQAHLKETLKVANEIRSHV